MEIKVPFSFPVLFTKDMSSLENRLVLDLLRQLNQDKKAKVFFAVEEAVSMKFPKIAESIRRYCEINGEFMELSSDPYICGGGENVKTFGEIEKICRIINLNGLCRHSFVCIVGGGAFLDAIGFAASIVHRGIRQIRFPTTVLSQADSGVGVKNGVNMFGKKNYIGTFSPAAVVNDFNFLETLDTRDWISGVSEAFKVAMIKDAGFFSWLCENSAELARRNGEKMEELVFRCAQLHVSHIRDGGDPFESGSARPLDFGHWSAHKLETMSDGAIRHGEAVAIGITLDARYAVSAGLLLETDLARLVKSLRTLGFRLWTDLLDEKTPDGRYRILSGIEEFREHLGGELHITLPSGIGNKMETTEMSGDKIISAIGWMKKIQNENP